MGGLSCAVPHLAIIRPDGLPTDPAHLPTFDAQLLECFKQTDIIKGIVDSGQADKACAILGRPPPLSDADRRALYAMIESLYS